MIKKAFLSTCSLHGLAMILIFQLNEVHPFHWTDLCGLRMVINLTRARTMVTARMRDTLI